MHQGLKLSACFFPGLGGGGGVMIEEHYLLCSLSLLLHTLVFIFLTLPSESICAHKHFLSIFVAMSSIQLLFLLSDDAVWTEPECQAADFRSFLHWLSDWQGPFLMQKKLGITSYALIWGALIPQLHQLFFSFQHPKIGILHLSNKWAPDFNSTHFLMIGGKGWKVISANFSFSEKVPSTVN